MKGVEAWTLLCEYCRLRAACAALGPWFLRIAPIPLACSPRIPTSSASRRSATSASAWRWRSRRSRGSRRRTPTSRRLARVALALFALLWVSGFDIIYATLDEQFDRAHGVHSLVAQLGREAGAAGRRLAPRARRLPLLAMVAMLVAPGLHGWADFWRALPPLAVLGGIKCCSTSDEMGARREPCLLQGQTSGRLRGAALVIVTRAVTGGF